MPNFQWKGEGLKAVAPLLAAKGWVPAPSGVLLVRTARAQLPSLDSARDERGWVWLSGERPGPKLLQAAVDLGALDVITIGQGWEQRLLARLEETLTPEPPMPPVKDFVAESAAAKALLRKLHQAAQTAMPVLLTG